MAGGFGQDPIMQQNMIGAMPPFAAMGQMPQMRTAFSGLPFMQNPMMAMLGQSLMQQFGKQLGMRPFALSDQNLFDQMRAQQFGAMRMQVAQQMMDRDLTGFIDLTRAANQRLGLGFDMTHQEAAKGIAMKGMQVAMPFMAMAPGMLDQAMAAVTQGRGSQMAMAMNMFTAQRTMLDPLTGQIGVSPSQAVTQSKALFDSMFGGPTAEMRQRMMGTTAGEIGQLYTSLAARGMLSPGSRRDLISRAMRGNEEAAQAARGGLGEDFDAGDVFRASSQEIDKLMAMPAISGAVQANRGREVRRRLEGFNKAISAMREIMGSDASPEKLMQGLEAMMGPAIGQMDPGRIATIVRQTQQMTDVTGIPMQHISMIRQGMMNQMNQMGMNAAAAPELALQTAAFGAAARDAGLVQPGAFGQQNLQTLMLNDARSRINAQASSAANNAAALTRLDEAIGGFSEGGRLAGLVAQAQQGTLSRIPRMDEILTLVAEDPAARRAGLTTTMVENAFADRFSNQKALTNNAQLVANVRRLQGAEIRSGASDFVGIQLKGTLLDQGMSQKEIDTFLTPDKIKEFTDSIFATDTITWSDDKARRDHIAERLKDLYSGTSFGRGLADKLEERGVNIDKFAQTMAMDVVGALGRGTRYNPALLGRNTQELFQRQRAAEIDILAFQGRAAVQAQISEAMTGERGGIMRRGISAFLDPRKNLTQVIASAFGFEATDELRARLQPAFKELRDMITGEDFQKEIRRIGAIADPVEREAQATALIKQKGGLLGAVSKMREALEATDIATKSIDKQSLQKLMLDDARKLVAEEADNEKAAMDKKEGKDTATATLGPQFEELQTAIREGIDKLIEAQSKPLNLTGELTIKGGKGTLSGTAQSVNDVAPAG